MAKKLINVFRSIEDLNGPKELEEAWSAFKGAFPSLKAITASAIAETWNGYDGNLMAQIDESSVNAEWPASYELSVTKEKKGRFVSTTKRLVVRPYTGDRFFEIAEYYHMGDRRHMRICCDYSERPSSVAARDVIELIEAGVVFRDANAQWK